MLIQKERKGSWETEKKREDKKEEEGEEEEGREK